MRITNCYMFECTASNNVVLQVKADEKNVCYIASFKKDDQTAISMTARCGDAPTKFLDLDITVAENNITVNGEVYAADKIITLE